MKKLLILMFVMVLVIPALVSAFTNKTIFIQTDFTGDETCTDTEIITTERFCVNATFSDNSTQFAINTTTGTTSINGGIIQICEDNNPNGNLCDCIAGTVLNVTFGGTANISIPTSTTEISDTMSYTIDTTRKYMFRFGSDTINGFGTCRYDGAAAGVIMCGSNPDDFGELTWSCGSPRSFYYMLWNVIGDAAPLDTTLPSFATSSRNTTPRINEVVGLGQEVLDDTGLNAYRLADNQTGTLLNNTEISISGTNVNATFNLSMTLSRGNVVSYQWWVEDTSGNTNTSEIFTFTVANTPPETPTILFPTSSVTNTVPVELNVTFPADLDGDPITIFYSINGTINSSSSANTTFEAEDGNYTLEVSLFDGFDSSANSTVSFSIDTINPILIVTSPADLSTHSANIPVDISCTDANIFLLNYTLSNGSGVLTSEQDDTPIASELSIVSTIDITNIVNGDYDFNASCSDSHTSKSIENYFPFKDNGNLKIFYTITENNNDLIGIKLKTNTATLDDFGTYKTDDRYILWFDFLEVEDGTIHIYKFKISNTEGMKYLPDSKYKGHFVTSYNWIDFEFTGNENAIYTIKALDDGGYEVKIETTKTFLEFRSVGGLNIVTEDRTITINRAFVVERQTTQLLENFLITSLAIGIIIAVIAGFIIQMRGKRKIK